MHMPKPGDAHEKLARFVGSWTITETMYPSPWDAAGGTAEGRTEYRMGCDGFFLIADYEQHRNGAVTYRGHGVYGWDPRTGKFTMHWFDSMGGDPGAPAPGDWNGDDLVFQHQTPMGHTRYHYQWQGRDRFTFCIESSRDGASWTPFLDSVYTRAA